MIEEKVIRFSYPNNDAVKKSQEALKSKMSHLKKNSLIEIFANSDLKSISEKNIEDYKSFMRNVNRYKEDLKIIESIKLKLDELTTHELKSISIDDYQKDISSLFESLSSESHKPIRVATFIKSKPDQLSEEIITNAKKTCEKYIKYFNESVCVFEEIKKEVDEILIQRRNKIIYNLAFKYTLFFTNTLPEALNIIILEYLIQDLGKLYDLHELYHKNLKKLFMDASINVREITEKNIEGLLNVFSNFIEDEELKPLPQYFSKPEDGKITAEYVGIICFFPFFWDGRDCAPEILKERLPYAVSKTRNKSTEKYKQICEKLEKLGDQLNLRPSS